MRQVVQLLSCLGIVIGGVSQSLAAEWKPEDLLEIVAKSSTEYLKAYKDRDAHALAELFTSEAEYIDGSGLVFHGREAIELEHQVYFESAPEGELTVEMTSIRPIAANVIVEEGISEFRPKEDGPISLVTYTATHVKQEDGQWKLASIRELSEPVLAPHEQLKKLGWLIGQWRDESANDVVQIEWSWSEDGHFLLAEYQVQNAVGNVRQGTHRVGWDSQKKQFRSWIFSSSGTFTEGYWTEVDGVWDIDLTAMLPDGSAASQILRFERFGPDALVVSQFRRQVTGTRLEDIQTRIVRVPPAPGELSTVESNESK